MWKTRRRALQFDSLEGKVLLSTGMGDPARAVHHGSVKRFVLNGSVSGLPNGTPGVGGFTETSFPVAGRLGSLGNVNGSFHLAESFIPMGKLPDLGGASLTLSSAKGTIQLAIAHSGKGRYQFTVVSGTNAYVSASGAGTLSISAPKSALNLVMRLHSTSTKV